MFSFKLEYISPYSISTVGSSLGVGGILEPFELMSKKSSRDRSANSKDSVYNTLMFLQDTSKVGCSPSIFCVALAASVEGCNEKIDWIIQS